MIREAAQGHLSEDQIHHLLSQKDLSLAQIEEYMSQEENIPYEIV